MAKDKKSIISLFEENEMRVSRLYSLYSQKIPGHKRFWKKISQEEVEHSNAISEAFNSTKQEEHFKENKFLRGIINYITEFVEKETEKTRKNEISHAEAVQAALRLEQSMIEKKCFELFIPTNNSLKNILKKLNRETEKHIGMLQDEWKKINK